MGHLKEIARDLERNVYKNPMHGNIAKVNFEYGVGQAKLEFIHIIKEREEHYAEQNCKADEEYAPKDRIAYLAGKRDAMTELLEVMKEE